jgi:hypothetical protein
MKVIIVGDSKTGKTAFISQLKGRPEKKYIPTIGVEHTSVNSEQIWDTSGDKKFSYIIRRYYERMDVMLFVYKDLETFNDIESYAKDFNGKLVIVYNGTDERLFELGYLYGMMYDCACFGCDISLDSNVKWVWSRIMKKYNPKPKSDKKWRYCGNLDKCWFF